MEYEFEKYPRLAEMMQEYAAFGKFSNWSEFIEELNKALQQVKSVDLDSVGGALLSDSDDVNTESALNMGRTLDIGKQ